ncbi:MAG: isoprenyl transferase [Rhodospirillales bacterium]|nr:isoprenyl transferase [Rhodospirillales bacterium]
MSALTQTAAAMPADAPPAPRHVAIIMDGNRRWARSRGLPRLAGHRAGVEAVRRTVRAAIQQGVGWLTLYAFSSENWRRPPDEVLDLTGLLRHFVRAEMAELARQGVRLRFIGDRNRFSPEIRADLAAGEELTQANRRLTLVVALSYGARDEIVSAARAVAEAAAAGRLNPADLNEASFTSLLSTEGMPDPDLVIRTSGEQRLSNFLLWQSAYAELLFLDVMWPDFGEHHFAGALAEFARRERRFGARPG